MSSRVTAPVHSALKRRQYVLNGRTVTPYLLFLPALVLIFGVVLYPTAYAFWLAFQNYSLTNPAADGFAGWGNFRRIFGDSAYWSSLRVGLLFTFGSLLPQVVLGLLFANLLNYKQLKFKLLFRGLVILPWLVPTVTVAILWRWMFNDLYGVINGGLLSLGLIDAPINWLGDRNLALFALIVANVWRGLPLMVILFLAGLQGIPEQLYEAARIDGAGIWRQFRSVTLPLLAPVIGIAVILRTIWIFNFFDLPYLMTFGGPAGATTTMPLYAYQATFGGYRLGLGSAVTVTMFFILLGFALLYFRYQRDV